MTNIQSPICSAPDLCKNVSLAVLFGRNGKSHKISKQSDMCICELILHNIVTPVGRQKKLIGATVNAASRLGTRVIGSPTLAYPKENLKSNCDKSSPFFRPELRQTNLS
jgi:hypothetical protein